MRKNGTTLHLRATSFPTSNNLELKAEDYEAANSTVFQVAVTDTLNAACQAKFGTEDNQITAYNDDKVLARFSSELEFTSNDIEDILIQVEDLSKELDDEKNFFDITNAKYNECLTNFQEGEKWYKCVYLYEFKRITSSTAKGEALLEKVNNIVQEQGNIFENSIEIWNALRETEEFKNMVETYEKLWAINEAVIEQNNSFWLNLSDVGDGGSLTPYALWVCYSKGYFTWKTDDHGLGAKTLTATAVLCPVLTLDASILTSQNGFVER